MHNYFKADIIETPIKKKYERKQVAGAIIVGVLCIPLSEIEQGLYLVLADTSPEEGYANFVKIFNEQSSQKKIKKTPVTSINLETTSSTILYNIVWFNQFCFCS
ncbi:MAG: DUF1836 domain-containing protein [Liquorilactobacillus hordei]|uniref:DUF1836 domain-containing protein n=1 Tax=Liquorilactobacillus hordei TaxID=468911 RepID=UPI0039E9D412